MGAIGAQQPTLSSPPCLSSRASSPPLPYSQLQPTRPRWGRSTSRAGGRTAMLGLCFEPRGVLLLPPPALPEPGHVLPAHRAPLSPWQAEAEGPPCQRLGTSLNPYSASTSSLSLRQHIWLILPLLFFGACEGRSSYPVTASPPGNVSADPGSGALPSPTPTPDPSLHPPSTAAVWHSFFLQKKQTFGLYLRSHVPCAVSRLSHLCPALQLIFKSLGCPHSQVPLWCHVRHFARKSHLGKDRKDKK